MATLATTHGQILSASKEAPGTQSKTRQRSGQFDKFVRDLIEDVSQKPLQAAHLAKHDMFREHILAMSISYFALIILLIFASIPVMAYFMR